MNAHQKVAALRKLMKRARVDAYYVPSADPHQSEYLPEDWKHRAWLSGFTGSMGELLVGARKAGLWTDGRYFLQACQELTGSGIDLMKMGEPGTPEMPTWVAKQLKKGQILGMDPERGLGGGRREFRTGPVAPRHQGQVPDAQPGGQALGGPARSESWRPWSTTRRSSPARRWPAS